MKFSTEHYMHHCHNELEEAGAEGQCNYCLINKRVAQFELIHSKGVFSFFLDQTELPDQSCFDSSLYNGKCSDVDYWKAQQIWEIFDMASMKDFHNHYLKTDVLLLMDFFEKFRK